MKRVLFLCTGNYYRSRFAECLFNDLAEKAGVGWRADSCGLRVQADGVVNHGPMSAFARAGLAERRITVGEPCRYPRQARAADMETADLIVALKEAEHRPMIEALFPQAAPRAVYWQVHDLDAALPADALQEIEARVRALIDQLK